jgi:hypothetical protein
VGLQWHHKQYAKLNVMYMQRRGTNWLGVLLGFLVVLLLTGISAIAVWEFFQIKDLKQQVEQAQTEAGNARTTVFELNKQEEVLRALLAVVQQETPQQTQVRVLKAVGEQTELPKGEEPQLAQVLDATKLTDQPFLKDVENGDFIIIYKKAKVSIVYRLADNKIINSGPVTTE